MSDKIADSWSSNLNELRESYADGPHNSFNGWSDPRDAAYTSGIDWPALGAWRAAGRPEPPELPPAPTPEEAGEIQRREAAIHEQANREMRDLR